MNDADIERASREFKRKQRLGLIGFAAVLILALVATIGIIVYSNHRARISAEEEQDKIKAELADPAYVIARVLKLDQEALTFTNPDDPTVFVWRGGLHLSNPNQVPSSQTNPKLLEILNDRRHLMGSLGGLNIGSSKLATDYVCRHPWFVIAGSFETNTPDDWLSTHARDDRRISLTSFVTGPIHPSEQGLIVGWFLSIHDAKKLAEEIDQADGTKPFIKSWDFGTNQPNCSPEIKSAH